jgi:K+-sensing histidine kinase KdpD
VDAPVAERDQRALLSRVFHDLRTPLGAIIGFAEVLTAADVEVDESTRQEFLREILTASRRMHRLLDELQDVPRYATASSSGAAPGA